MSSAIKKYLIKKLADKAGYSPEELPMSISEPRLMEDLRRGRAPIIPGGPYKKGEASRLDIKFPIQPKTKTQKELSAIEKRILQEKILDKILENPFATIKRQRVESSDDVIDIPTGMPIEEARKKLADVPAEIKSGKTIIGRVGKLSPTTITRSKAVDLKSAKAKELVRLMNKLEEAELKGTDIEEITKIRKQLGLKPIGKKDGKLTLIPVVPEKPIEEKINRITNKEDRKALREIFKTKKIIKGKTPAKQPRDEESQLPNIVGQASDPKSPVTKLDIQADPGFAPKTDQEFFNNRVENYLDQGDDLKTARSRARNDLGEKKLSEEYTEDQLRDLLGKGILETDRGEITDEATKRLETTLEKLGLFDKKKAGGQVGKPKRKIKKSVRGNNTICFRYRSCYSGYGKSFRRLYQRAIWS